MSIQTAVKIAGSNMLQRTFILLDYVGYATEQRLWDQGIKTWNDFIEARQIKGISDFHKEVHDREIEKAKGHLRDENSSYFYTKLRPRDHWRGYDYFKKRACHIDIETTGLSRDWDDITVVGIYDGREVRTFIKDINLDEESLVEELSKYKMLVTFYGSAFDLPFIRRKFPSARLNMLHMDLCFTGRRVGLRGGLKRVEKAMGIKRDEEIKDIGGLDAVRLWHEWESKRDEGALETLIKYNREDVVNLEKIADAIYEKMKMATLPMP